MQITEFGEDVVINGDRTGSCLSLSGLSAEAVETGISTLGDSGSCELAVLLAADAFDIPFEHILAATRGASRNAHARQAAMYLAHAALGITLTAIGKFFRRDHSTVAHGCHRVEDRRDDPAFDMLMAELAIAARMTRHLDCEIGA